MTGYNLTKYGNMFPLKKKKEANTKQMNLLKSKVNLKKQSKAPNLKHLKILDNSLVIQLESHVILPEDWEDEYQMKEIFKNSVYGTRSNISLDASDNSIRGKNIVCWNQLTFTVTTRITCSVSKSQNISESFF